MGRFFSYTETRGFLNSNELNNTIQLYLSLAELIKNSKLISNVFKNIFYTTLFYHYE